MSISERIDAITAIPLAYRAEILAAPPSVKIELTSTCNYRCAFCSHATTRGEGDMDRQLYSRLIADLHASGVRELGVFYIGESFTCEWLPNAIAEAKDIGFEYVFLTTNGSLATPERVRACMASGLDSLKFSVNNATSEQFSEVTGVAPRWFERSLSNLKSAREIRDQYGFPCRLYASSIRYDGQQQELMRDVIETRVKPYVDEWYELPLFDFGGQARDRELDRDMAPTVGNPGRLEAMRPPLPCWSVFREGHITSTGILHACCFGGDDDLAMADLKRVSFMDGWNSTKFQELRRRHLQKDIRGTGCERCIAAM